MLTTTMFTNLLKNKPKRTILISRSGNSSNNGSIKTRNVAKLLFQLAENQSNIVKSIGMCLNTNSELPVEGAVQV